MPKCSRAGENDNNDTYEEGSASLVNLFAFLERVVCGRVSLDRFVVLALSVSNQLIHAKFVNGMDA